MPTSNLNAESVVTKDKKSGLPLEGRPDCRSIHYVRGLNLTSQFTVTVFFPCLRPRATISVGSPE